MPWTARRCRSHEGCAGAADRLAAGTLAALLRANYAGSGSGGAGSSIGLAPDGRLYLQRPVAVADAADWLARRV